MITKTLLIATTATAMLGVSVAQADHNTRGNWSPPGNAYGNRDDYRRGQGAQSDYARVVNVEPITRRIRHSEPRRECWNETAYQPRYYNDRDSYRTGARGDRPAAGQMILGGIIGAAIGNQIGRGDGRRAATVGGAIIGSAIGHDAAQRGTGRRYDERYGNRYNDRYDDRYNNRDDDRYGRDVERCSVRYEDSWQERVDGYRVTYEYNGRQYTTRLPYDPGEQVRVRVQVFPDEG